MLRLPATLWSLVTCAGATARSLAAQLWSWWLLALCAGALVGGLDGAVVLITSPLQELPQVWGAPLSVLGLDLLACSILGLAQAPLLAPLARWLGRQAQRHDLRPAISWTAVAAMLTALVTAAATLVMMGQTERFTDRPFAAGLVAFAVPVAALVSLALAFGGRVLVLAAQRRSGWMLRPRWHLWTVLAALLGLLFHVGWTLWQWGPLLHSYRTWLWLLLFVVIEALLLWTLQAWPALAKRVLRLPSLRAVRILALALLLLGLVGAQAQLSLQPAAAPRLLVAGGLSAPTLRALRGLLDLDRDGVSAVLAGGDCDDLNARRHPLAVEIAGNGIDEDCDGVDATNVGGGAINAFFDATPAGAVKRYNIIIACIDALRADRVGYAGYPRPITPYLDRLAARSWVFLDVIAASSTTRQSLPVLLSGRDVSGLRWLRQRPVDQLADDNFLLAEVLKPAGYHTVAVVDEWLPKFLPTIGQGFDFFQTAYGQHKWHTHGQHAGPFTNAMALEQMLGHERKVPFLLYLHYEAPHHPYVPHPEVVKLGLSATDLYDGEIAYADRHLGTLLEILETRGLLDNTIIVVFGDHGQEFKEHGQTRHSRSLHAESVRVPLLIHVPGQKPGRFDGRSGLIDVMPTLMDLLGLHPKELRPQGVSLLHRVFGGRVDRDRELLLELLVLDGGRRDNILALYRGRHKLIWNQTTGARKLYDVVEDPAEQQPLDDTKLLEEMVRALKEKVRVSGERP